MRAPLSLILALQLAVVAWAAPPRPAEVANPAITAAEITAHVRYLASPELEGRGSGTPGNDKAADYLAARFRAVGLRPAGEKGSYFQRFPVFTGVTLGERNLLTLQTGEGSLRLKVRQDFMPPGFAKNAQVEAPLVFAGYGISQPELGYDDYAGVDVRGKIAIVLRYTPDGDDSGKFGPYAQLTYKALTAREKGAAGLLLVTGPASAEPENLGRLSAGASATDCGIPVLFVKREHIERLLAEERTGLAELQTAMAHGQPRSFALSKARAKMRADVRRQIASTRNVLGLLEGSDPARKHEVVVVGAHYDHLGLGGEHSLAEGTDPQVHPGADDNASGTAGVLELAQYFAARRPRPSRTLLFVGFSGEEIGLLGSNYWTKNPTVPLERVVAMVNMDMIGRMRNDTVSVIGAGSSPAWKELLEGVNRSHRLTLRTGGASGFGGSDQQSFYARQIPVLFFFTGVHPDYHRPTDTWEKVDAAAQARLLHLVADTIEAIAALPERPAFQRAADQETSPGPGFRVYLGTIPDYAEEVEGVALQGVREGSPAEQAGLRAGDILVEFGGKKVRNVQEYTALLGTARAGVPVEVVVLRGGARLQFKVTPTARR